MAQAQAAQLRQAVEVAVMGKCGDETCTEEHGDDTEALCEQLYGTEKPALSNEAQRMFEEHYTCKDPNCTATHVDMADVPDVEFKEDFAIYEQSLHSMNERMRNR